MPETISIEHELPQTPQDASQRKIDFTELEESEWTNKMQNLVLISRRKKSARSNKAYAEKKEMYFKSHVELFSNFGRIYNQYSTWNLNDIKKSHPEVLNKIKQGYGL